MPSQNNNNLHKDHRRRVKERFLSGGLEHFSPHEVLELLLFYAVPQKDTNVLGHRLLTHFGSLSRVFNASYEELCSIDGVGEHAATLLQLVLPVASYVLSREQSSKAESFDTVERMGQFFVKRYMGVRNEFVDILLLNNRFSFLECVRVHEGSINSVAITPRRLLEIAIQNHAAMAVIAHNHPGGMAVPSHDDIETTLDLRSAFSAVGVTLLEHIVVAGNYYSPILLRLNLTSVRDETSSFLHNDCALAANVDIQPTCFATEHREKAF